MALFILTILGLMLSADLWWWWRADRLLRDPTMPRSRAWRLLLAVFMTAAIAGLIAVLASRAVRFAFPAWAIAALFIWHFLVLPFVAVPSLLVSLASMPARFFRRGKPESTPDSSTESVKDFSADAPTLSRRNFLAASLAAVPPLVTVVSTVRAMDQLDEFRVRSITIPLANLPPDLDGLSIAHVSDVHVGSFTNGRTLDRIADAVNALHPDLVLQTGDIINNSLSDLPAALDMARRFDSRFGQFLIEGNHDLFQGRLAFDRRVRASGLPLLLNETASISVRGVPVQIMGLRWGFVGPLDDPDRRQRGGRESVARSMKQLLDDRPRDGEAFRILLAHHPHAFDFAAEAGIPLTLAGHTHGGQLHATPRLGFGPWMYRYWTGLYRKGDGNALVVSNGVGNWFPLRINAPAEIVHITLKRA
jgi:uncharacterized protein